MPVIIRSAVLDDVTAVLAIEQKEASAAHWTPQQYQRLLEAASGTLLVAEEEGALRGFLAAKQALDQWEIENVVVAHEFQRRGLADKLVSTLVESARKDRASSILLEVRESNLLARRLYEKHGFLETGRRRRYYREPAEDAVLYELRLVKREWRDAEA